jgi:hypothetical protein
MAYCSPLCLAAKPLEKTLTLYTLEGVVQIEEIEEWARDALMRRAVHYCFVRRNHRAAALPPLLSCS